MNYDERMIPDLNLNTIEGETKDSEKEDELLSVDEISKILKVTTQQVRNLINSDKLKSVKLSERGTRVKKSDFDEFLNSRNLK